MRPMAKKGGSMEAAWQEVGPMRPMGPRGPMLGDHMAEQFMHHMRPPGPMEQEAGFFTDGPMAMSAGPAMGDDWAAEMMSAGPRGPAGGLLRRPPMAAMRPPGADWAAEFAMAGPRPPMAPVEMEAAFKQAEMEAAFAGARPPMPPNDMEAAFMAARPVGPMDMEAAFQQAQAPHDP